MFFLGDRLAVDKHFDEAIAYYTGCLALRPTHLYAFLSRAEAYEKAGDKLTAERDFVVATELVEPVDHVIAFSKLLEFYGRTRQPEKHAESLARLRTEGHRLISEQTSNAGEDDPNTLELLRLLGETLCLAEAYSDGIPMLQQSLARHRIVFGSVHAKTLLPMNNLGLRLNDSNRAAEAVPLLEEALAVSTQVYGQDHNNTLILMGNLGHTYAKTGRAEQAVSLEEKALARFEQKGETRHRLDTRHKLGFAYNQAQMWDKAVPFLRDTLALDIQELGPEHDQTLITMWNLGVACDGSGQADMAVPLLEDAFEKHMRLLGENADRTLLVLNDLALALIHAGKAGQSLPLLTRSVDVLRRQLGADHQETLIATFNLGGAYSRAGQFADGVDVYEKLLETYTRLHGVEHPKTLVAGGALLEACRLAGRREEGKRLALSRLQILRTQADEIQLSSGLAEGADAFLAFDMYPEAERLARECVQICSVKFPDTWLHFNALSLLGGTLIGQGKYEEGEPLLLQAFEGLELHKDEIPPNAQRHIKATIDRLIQLYESTNRPDEVVRWKAKLPESQAEQPIAK
jgi:tetratricopeptide (TPR) repeat protein